jgi:pyruvoyl-dependent arginine decarboxylase (PvlArgDC)
MSIYPGAVLIAFGLVSRSLCAWVGYDQSMVGMALEKRWKKQRVTAQDDQIVISDVAKCLSKTDYRTKYMRLSSKSQV